MKRCEGALVEPFRCIEYGAAVKDALGGSAYEVTSCGFCSYEEIQQAPMVVRNETYTVNAYAFALDPDHNLGTLPLLDAADAAHASCVDAPVGGADRL